MALIPGLVQSLDAMAIRDGKMLVGVSGGADSVALLRGLAELSPDRGLQLVVGHFDHAIRAESAADANWVNTLGQSLGIPVRSERSDRSGEGTGLAEEQARTLRYEFLRRTAEAEGCGWIAVAHTADDQVETVFHHIVRGSGLQGLSGIPALRTLSENVATPLLVRPLLQVSRKEILAFLASIQQDFCTDSTNESRSYTRNRIRNEILPLLRADLNPRVDDALLRLCEQAADAQLALTVLARELLTGAVLDQQPGNVRFQRELLQGRPPALLREAFSQIWRMQGWPRQSWGFAHLSQLVEMVTTGKPAKASLPGGIEAICREKVFELRRES
ncbi:tRNA lysidine(34) synthetase TilS [Planctomicrobium sp. SH661]|uniref:tRNA lysidine(34) synthetase TilS n=1 Tax=Planctomicrobium sp. SH661 TaxID=3448124 RepID=UPI003F5C6F52